MTTLLQTAVTTAGELEQTPARIILRTEADADWNKLDKVQPHDQRAFYQGYYQDRCLILERMPDPRQEVPQATKDSEARKLAIGKLLGMQRADMKTIAAECGVAWDDKASKSTMADRIVDAQTAAAAQP